MPVIVISGQSGCGSTTAARLLAKALKLRFFSAGEYYKTFGEGKSTERAVGFWKTEKGSSPRFHNALDEMVAKEATKGNVVCDAKLGVHFLKSVADFKIWLKASDSVRAERYAKRDSISVGEAEKLVKAKDRLERENFKRIYGFDSFSQEKEADLVVDVSKKTPEDVVSEIMKAIAGRKSIKTSKD
ncbi:MAG: cytidylate kinase family protein [Candidatus Aenigmarchaeota archaeon]|nr:cytidylate kinase family protein [Candidatus Aenigmarchaeota archaeon]